MLERVSTPVFELTVAASPADGAKQLASTRVDVLLLDLSTVASGLDHFWQTCPGGADRPIVALTPDHDQDLARQAIQHGAHEYLAKSELTSALLIRAIRYAQERHRWLADRSTRLDHELQMAALLQERFLPSTSPVLSGYELGGHLRASGRIGGDFYDFVELPEGQVGVALGDASGKGIPGALLMAKTQGLLRAEIDSAGAPRDVISRVSALVHRDNARDQFVTLFYAVLAPDNRRVRYVNAGHPRGLLFGADGVGALPATGPPLGVFADTRYDEAVVSIAPGDLLVIYSDGVTEAQTARDEFFDEAGIRNVVDRNRSQGAAEIARAVCHTAERFERGNPDEGDDKAVVVVRAAQQPLAARSAPPR